MRLWKMDEDELVKSIQGLIKEAADVQRAWQNRAKDSFKFLAGVQWSHEDEEVMKEQGRPLVTFNYVAPMVNLVKGMEADARKEITYNARHTNVDGLAEALKEILDYMRDEGEIEYHEADSFEDMLACGMGWTESLMDFEEHLDGTYKTEQVPPHEMTWDPLAKQKNLRDRKWHCHSQRMYPSEIYDMWPDKRREVEASIEASDDHTGVDPEESEEINVTDPTRYDEENGYEGSNRPYKRPRVHRIQWRESVKVWRMPDPRQPGEWITLTERQMKKARPMLEAAGTRTIEQKQKTYYEAFIVGEVLLEKRLLPIQSGFNINCLTGIKDKSKNQWRGMVEDLKDPQSWANKFFSSFMEIIASNSKGGIIMERDASDDQAAFERSWAKSDGVSYVKTGAIQRQKIMPKPSAPYPQGTSDLMRYAVEALYRVSGLNPDMMGYTDSAEVGIVQENRRKSAYKVLSPYFDALGHYRKVQGRIDLDYIKSFVPVQRMVEILGPDMAQYAMMIKQMDVISTRIEVSESAMSDHNRMITWSFMSTVVPQLLQLGVTVPKEIIEYSPLPSGLKDKWMKQIENQEKAQAQESQAQAQLQQMVQQLALARETTEIEKLQAEIEKLIADVQKSLASADESRADSIEAMAHAAQMGMEVQTGMNMFGG
jgi:hypothetical protein